MLAVVFKCLTCSTFDDVRVDVILRNVGGLLADVIPLYVTDRCSAAKGGGGKLRGRAEGVREPERSRVTG